MDYNVICPLADESDELYINMNGKKANRRPVKRTGAEEKEAVNEDVRTEIMANKMKHKKNKVSERGQKKREAKEAMKLKNAKKLKKAMVSAGKALKNGLVKQDKSDVNMDTKDIKPDPKLPFKPVYNSDGKLVFSKFDFAAGTTSLAKNKKSEDKHLQGHSLNGEVTTVLVYFLFAEGQKSAEVVLDELKKKDKEIKSLISSGDKAKALEIKSDMAWKKAFDKVEGKKVKDDVELLKKTIHKKEVKKKKSKVNWSERKKGEEKKLDHKIKKRNDNISKRSDDKKKKKVKQLAKQGRVVRPGF